MCISRKETETDAQESVSSIYIWSKNLVAESEAKDGGKFQFPARKDGYFMLIPFSAIVAQGAETDVL